MTTPAGAQDLMVNEPTAYNEKTGAPHEPVEVSFPRGDQTNPQEWSLGHKWRVLGVALFITFTSTFNATAQGSTSKGFRAEHPNISSELYLTSNMAYQLMLGVGPLILSPISEQFGRRPMLVVLTLLITILFLPQALAPNFASILATRFFQGAAGSVEGPVIAGIVADLFPKITRGTPLAFFVVIVYTGNALGPVCSNWLAFKTGHWPWVYWLQMAMNGVAFLLCAFFLPETRGELLLSKRANKLQTSSGRPHYAKGIVQSESMFEAFKRSSTRPLKFLFTEKIVAMCACWIGFAWGVVFLFIGAIAHVFTETYGFNQGQASSVLICGLIGAILGFIWNETVQAHLYDRAVVKGNGRAEPEARLYSSALGGILFAVGSFGFAWTARPWIFWFVPCIFITMANMGLYFVYLGTYAYLSDVYDRYSSSAQAAQSLLRGILGAVFPFFGIYMYDNLTFKWASTLVGFIAAAFALVPFIMIRYGAKFRAQSKIAVSLEHEEGAILSDNEAARPTKTV